MEKLFSSDAILRYPKDTPARALRHVCVEERMGTSANLDFDKAVALLSDIRKEISSWYKKETGKEMDTYQLGNMHPVVQCRFWRHEKFREAFLLLGLNESDIPKISLPWWNELAANEISHELTDHGPFVTLGPRHSFETQLIRAGVDIPISSVSVGGLILTSDDFLVIGLRGGGAYPNTFHINAGALGLTHRITGGSESIYDFYLNKELTLEFGLKPEDIQSPMLLSRIMDRTIDNGPMYVFLIRTSLPARTVQERYKNNIDDDKGEHTQLVFLPANDGAVLAFIASTYRGLVGNRMDRGNNEQYLLHPGALSLLSFTDATIDFLKSFYRPGVW